MNIHLENPVDKAPVACSVRTLLIRPSRIAFLRFTLEAYEGVATVTTIDPARGLVRLLVAPGCEDVVYRVLEDEWERLRWHAFDDVPSPESSLY